MRLAEGLGAKAAINAEKEDPVKTIMYLTDGKGLDVVFDAVGFESTFNQALKMVRRGGRIVVIGLGAQGRNDLADNRYSDQGT